VRAKAAVNAPHSKRFARFASITPTRQRLDCGDFSTAFARAMLSDDSLTWRARESGVNAPSLTAETDSSNSGSSYTNVVARWQSYKIVGIGRGAGRPGFVNQGCLLAFYLIMGSDTALASGLR
jgi:hypothetical protein